ncbi:MULTISPECIES: hypothetical protein [Roseomonadaceae]|uniref:Uncharacterized protein n=1 Tax=Falsiroseomonas oleicola TaxID=2801474 RepID=A0ABS6H8M2_9PROT|nr:hypothetical protein [Roseomonas oleicola]MBU8544318.1 hypothetical protein [Roseomonas oleicola]
MTNATTRRGVLAFAPAALLLSVAQPAEAPPLPPATPVDALPEADRRLLALRESARAGSAAYYEAMRAGWAADEAGDRAARAEADGAQEDAWAAYVTALEEMAEIPAAGFAGVLAKLSATDAYTDIHCAANAEEFATLASAAADAARILAELGLAAAAPAPVPSRDCALLTWCEQWHEAAIEREERFDLAPETMTASELRAEAALRHRMADRMSLIIGTPALTREGRVAKAEILEGYLDDRRDMVARLAASLVQDVTRGAA